MTLQTIDGQQFLELVLPSGNRLARVSAEELSQLRIACASGTGNFVIQQNLVTGAFEVTAVGTINY